jgi:cytosine/adenosine deaminase-related metal-dependent hydrolase
VRTMLAPDRIETCTPALLRRTSAASRELNVPVRLNCCQSRIEYEMVVQILLIGVSGRDVRHVFVGGRMVVVDGAIPGLDMHAANVRAQAQFAGLMARYPERTVGHPPVEEIFASSYPLRHRDRTGIA